MELKEFLCQNHNEALFLLKELKRYTKSIDMEYKDKVFYVPISTITQMKNDGCKSVGIKALDKYKIYEIPSIKKRTYMTSNYSILLTLQEGE